MGEYQKPDWQKGYKEVKNYLHNELGITREEMQEIIIKIVREEVHQTIGQNGEFIKTATREIIRQEMMAAFNDKYPSLHKNMYFYPEKDEFKKFISNVIKEEILDTLRDRFNLQFNLELKEK